MEKYKK